MIPAQTLHSLRPVTLTYGPLIPVTLLGGTLLVVTVTDAVAFVFNNPSGALAQGALLTLLIRNTSGGAHGAGTFGTAYRVAAAVPAIATGNTRAILFLWNGALLVELARGATDVPV